MLNVSRVIYSTVVLLYCKIRKQLECTVKAWFHIVETFSSKKVIFLVNSMFFSINIEYI